MFKLVIVGGELRGKEFELSVGENVIGREADCDIALDSSGVSKRHMKITVSGESAFLEDAGSSNGTFLNGKLIQRATIKDKDKIALPNLIIQVVYVEEKKVVIKRRIETEEILPEYLKPGDPPPNPFGKIIYLFKYKLMSIIHGVNEEYEWRSIFGIILTLFVVVTITLTIVPVLQDSKNILLVEIARRGTHYARDIERLNGQALEARAFDKLNTAFLEDEEGVESFELFDLEGRIVRPLSRLNDYISDPFSVEAREIALGSKATKNHLKFTDGQILISRRIQAYNTKTAQRETVGVVVIRFVPKSLTIEATRNSKAYLESLITSAMVAILFFGIVYYLTIRPIEEMKFEIEDALRGNRRSLEGRYLMTELVPLRESINNLLQKVREATSDEEDTSFEETEDDSSYIETLREFMKGSGVPVVILDSNKTVMNISPLAEDILGMREDSSQGVDILDVAREKGFAATVIELCDESASSNGESKQGSYELSGVEFNIFAASLLGKSSFPRGYYITLIREE
ncbi:FHA domain-containing protein [bacterium]|nr:FHA domain-containing protein [bacterium]